MLKYIIFILISFNAFAQNSFQNCNGIMTNKPCDEIGKKTTVATKKTKLNYVDNSKKESLLHDLRMLNIKAKRNHDINYNIELIEQECKNDSLTDCDKKVKSANKELKEIISQERITELKEEELSKKSEKEDSNKTTVVIQNNNVIIPSRLSPRNRLIKKPSKKSAYEDDSLTRKFEIKSSNIKNSAAKNFGSQNLLNKSQNFSSPIDAKLPE